jgi:ribosomal protein S18 acetylase RimI-like enzyme
MQLCDILSVGSRLRKADMKELTHNGRTSQYSGLFNALSDRQQSYTIEVAGSPEGLFGIGPAPHFGSKAGIIWMVATDELTRRAFYTFGKKAPSVIDEMLQENPNLNYVHNFVDEENTLAISWLKRLGFTLVSGLTRYDINFKLLIKENPYYV